MLDSVIRVSKKFFSNNFRRVYIWNKKTKMEDLINDDLDLTSSDNETDNEPDNDTEFDNDE